MPQYYQLTPLEKELIELQREDDGEDVDGSSGFPEREPPIPEEWSKTLQSLSSRGTP